MIGKSIQCWPYELKISRPSFDFLPFLGTRRPPVYCGRWERHTVLGRGRLSTSRIAGRRPSGRLSWLAS